MDTLKRYWWLLGLLVALAVALLSPLASPYLDGLERVAQDQGFLEQAEEAPYEVLPDYVFPGIQNEALATIVAGLVGTLVVFGIAYGLAWIVRRRTEQSTT
jgi:hypothetical protein